VKINLASPGGTLSIINKYDFAFQKKFGQNFLIDENVVLNIIERSGITKEDTVLEIGPGIGTMTQKLCEAAKEVIAVEIDKKLIPILEDTLSDYDNVTVINEDILKLDLSKITDKPIKVVANLPYYITTPIIMELLEKQDMVSSITVMVQKEVASRMQEGPGSKEYGALSLAVSYYANAFVILNVGANSFMPRPNVDSSVIKLERHKTYPVNPKNPTFMFKLIRASFNQRRKTLVNALSMGLGLEKEKVSDALIALELNPLIRGEALTLEQFAALSDKLL